MRQFEVEIGLEYEMEAMFLGGEISFLGETHGGD
jgi:hypothetical protein